MIRSALRSSLLFATILAAGCDPNADAPLDPAAEPQLAKSSNVDTDSRAVWEIQDWLTITAPDGSVSQIATRIRGDGRAADGSTSTTESSIYQGDRCGVHAKIFWKDPDYSQSGDAVFDPDMNYSTRNGCGAARAVMLHLENGTVVQSGPFTNARQVMQLAAGESRLQTMQWSSHGLSNCERLIFSTADGNDAVRVTRTADSPGVWTVESTGSHRAGCYKHSRGSYVYTGTSYTLPFSLKITEVPYAG